MIEIPVSNKTRIRVIPPKVFPYTPAGRPFGLLRQKRAEAFL